MQELKVKARIEKELKARIEKMLAGEQKRREVALRFLDAAQEVIIPACQEIWGDGDDDEMIAGGTWLRSKGFGGKVNDWSKDQGGGRFHWRHFYTDENGGSHTWLPGWYFGDGTAESQRGPAFWNGVRLAVDFIDYIDARLQAQEKSRESLVEKIRERFGISA